MATNVVLVLIVTVVLGVVVVRFNTIPLSFFILQPIVIKLQLHVAYNNLGYSTVLDF